MHSPDLAEIRQRLKTSLQIDTAGIEPVWEPSDWSMVFRVIDAENHGYYLKGTPRSRTEALVTHILHEHEPLHVPAVLSMDLMPENDWCWFVMADRGTADYDTLSFEQTRQTAFCLGQLQREVSADKRLPDLLPACLPQQYPRLLEDIGAWLNSRYPAVSPELVEIARSILPARQAYFAHIAAILTELPATCVHGDLWSGNIGFDGDQICLLDWGDAVWGTGTVSIINLLESLDEAFPADEIWQAYGEGWQQAISAEMIRASQVTYAVTALVIERELAQFDANDARVPVGIPPLLNELVALSD